MRAVAHNPAFAKKVGIPQSVGKDFSEADKGRKFGSGGNVKKEMKAAKFFAKAGEKKLAAHERREAMGKEKDTPAIARKEMSVLKKAKAPKDVMDYEVGEHAEMGMKRGGKIRKMADGGLPEVTVTGTRRSPSSPPVQGGPLFSIPKDEIDRMPSVTVEELGTMEEPTEKDRAPVQNRGRVTVEPVNEPFKRGGSVGGFRRAADGIASKGKTRGTMVRMASGGSVSSASRRADGIAQRGKTKGRMV
jgi:hypothetical protein